MQRCYNPLNKRWSAYGKRGIRVCARWHDVRAFVEDMGPSYSHGLQIERNDCNADYTPSNCCWVPASEQPKNRRNIIYITIDGETLGLAEWCRRFGTNYGTAWERIKVLSWDPVRAVTEPAPGLGGP